MVGFEADARELRADFFRHDDRAMIRPAETGWGGRVAIDGVVVDDSNGLQT